MLCCKIQGPTHSYIFAFLFFSLKILTCCLYSAKNIFPEIVKQIFLSCVYMMCKIQGLKYPLIFSFLFFKSKILTCCLYWWQTDEILSRRDLNSPILLFLLLFIFCNLLNFVVSGLSSVNYCQNVDPFSFFLWLDRMGLLLMAILFFSPPNAL